MESPEDESRPKRWQNIRETTLVLVAAMGLGGGFAAWSVDLYDRVRVDIFRHSERIGRLEDATKDHQEHMAIARSAMERLRQSTIEQGRELSELAGMVKRMHERADGSTQAAARDERSDLANALGEIAQRLERLEQAQSHHQ